MAVFPNIEGLEDIPKVHFQYAQVILKHIITKIYEQDSLDIGLENGKASIINFYGETDNLELSLLFENRMFKVRVLEHGDALNIGKFEYNLTEGEMEDYIPSVVREEMTDVCFQKEPREVDVKNLRIESNNDE